MGRYAVFGGEFDMKDNPKEIKEELDKSSFKVGQVADWTKADLILDEYRELMGSMASGWCLR